MPYGTDIKMVCKKGVYIMPQRIIISNNKIRAEAYCAGCSWNTAYGCRFEDGIIDIAIKEVQNGKDERD